jgi:hypothetical protein
MITITDKLRCVERELSYRRRVYARLVANGKMTAALADRELEVMTAIVGDYQQLEADEPLELFAARAGG